jgi:GDP-L-fucose synthase
VAGSPSRLHCRALLASAILHHLISLGFINVVILTHAELDLSQQADVKSFFPVELPCYVVLATAKVGGIHANSTFTVDFIAANLQIAM